MNIWSSVGFVNDIIKLGSHIKCGFCCCCFFFKVRSKDFLCVYNQLDFFSFKHKGPSQAVFLIWKWVWENYKPKLCFVIYYAGNLWYKIHSGTFWGWEMDGCWQVLKYHMWYLWEISSFQGILLRTSHTTQSTLFEHWACCGLLGGGVGWAREVTTGSSPTQHFNPSPIFQVQKIKSLKDL